jgi:hypothetical protein
MHFLNVFMASFKGVASFLAGQAAVRETAKMIRNVRLAMIAAAAVGGMLFLCTLIISAYFLLRIVQELS